MKIPVGTEVVLIKSYDPFDNGTGIPVGTLGVVGGSHYEIGGTFTSVVWDFDFETVGFNEENLENGLLMDSSEIDTVL